MRASRLPLFASVCLLLSLLVLMSSVEAKKKKYVGETGGDFEFIDEVSPKWLSVCVSACLTSNCHPIQLSCGACVRLMCVCVYACAVAHITHLCF